MCAGLEKRDEPEFLMAKLGVVRIDLYSFLSPDGRPPFQLCAVRFHWGAGVICTGRDVPCASIICLPGEVG